jgi:hypothetical protein
MLLNAGMHRWLLTALMIVACLGLSALALVLSRVGARPAAVEQVLASITPDAPSDAGGDRHVAIGPPDRGTPPPTPSARQVLREWWGELPAEIEESLKAEGVNLDAPYEYPPWEQVVERFRIEIGTLSEAERDARTKSMVSWPDEISLSALAQKFPIVAELSIELHEAHLVQVDSLVREQNTRLSELAYAFCDGLRAVKHIAWTRGDFLKSPVSTVAIPRPSRRAFYATAAAHSGWGAKMLLFADEHPDLDSILGEAAQVRMSRDSAVTRYLKSLK